MNSIKHKLISLSLLLMLGTTAVFAETSTNKMFDFSALGISNFAASDVSGDAALTVDKGTYAEGEMVVISGAGFGGFESVTLSVENYNASLRDVVTLAQWNVFADAKGNISANLPIDSLNSTSGVYTIKAVGTETKASAETVFSAIALVVGVDIEQCGNGPLSNPNPCNIATGNDGWTRGNLNESKSHYKEGDSVPIRVIATGLTPTQSYTITVGYDLTKGGKYAVDYLTDYDRTESVNNDPCTNVAGCTLASEQTFAIPTDPQVTAGFDQTQGTADDITQIAGSFSIFGGTITAVSGYGYSGAPTGDSTKSITVTFTANQENVVLAYGSHISTRTDWGIANSAINISGSPYHNFVVDFPGSNHGNRDLQLSATAVIFPASITIIKDSQPNTPLSFNFSATGQVNQNFTLVDNGVTGPDRITFNNLTAFGAANSVTVTETSSNGSFALVAINCQSFANGGPGVNNNTTSVPSRFATIVLEEGESVVCTFVNAVTTAASATVGGATLTESGMPLARSRVTIQNTATGESQTTYTNNFGRYQFEGLTVGDFYVITVSNRKYVFSPDTQGFTLNEAVEGLNFTASNP